MHIVLYLPNQNWLFQMCVIVFVSATILDVQISPTFCEQHMKNRIQKKVHVSVSQRPALGIYPSLKQLFQPIKLLEMDIMGIRLNDRFVNNSKVDTFLVERRKQHDIYFCFQLPYGQL